MSRTGAATVPDHRCRMLLFLLKDGTKLGFTDHNKDVPFTLPEDGDPIAYSAGSGFRISDVEQPFNLDPGSFEVSGPIGDVVTLPQLLGGRWRRATVYLFDLNWKSPTAAIDLMKGAVTKCGPSGGEFRFEVQDERHKLAQIVGRSITNQCPRNFDACCVNIAPETETTVAAVTSELVITLTDAITGADFIGGKLWFTDGPLAGNDPIEIFVVSVDGLTVTLFEPLPDVPEVGNAVTLKEGCDGSVVMCRDRFSNAINNRGFAGVPGSKALLPAIPGQGSDGDA